jgi:hypothetical protein
MVAAANSSRLGKDLGDLFVVFTEKLQINA